MWIISSRHRVESAMTLFLGGALRFTEYDYCQEQIVNSLS